MLRLKIKGKSIGNKNKYNTVHKCAIHNAINIMNIIINSHFCSHL